MSILYIVVVALIILFALYIVQKYLPVPFKTPVLVIVVVLALLWLVSLLFPGLTTARVG